MITWREALEHEAETYRKLQAEIDAGFEAEGQGERVSGCGVLEIKKLLWRPKRFIEVDVTYEQAQTLARAHNRWWKPTHYDIVPPVVMQGLKSGRYADPNWSPPL